MPSSWDLRTLLLQRAEEVLEDHPELGHVESDDGQESVTLTFPRQAEGGFDVVIEATLEEIILFANGAHVQFDRPYDRTTIRKCEWRRRWDWRETFSAPLCVSSRDAQAASHIVGT